MPGDDRSWYLIVQLALSQTLRMTELGQALLGPKFIPLLRHPSPEPARGEARRASNPPLRTTVLGTVDLEHRFAVRRFGKIASVRLPAL